MSLNKKILLITYYWPPSGGVGVQRWMNFTIQLQKRGWDVTVLIPQNPQFEIKDEKLLERVEDIKTVKVPIWEPFNIFHSLTGNKERKNVQQGLVLEKADKNLKDRLAVWIRGNLIIPDPRVYWVKPAAKKAIELIDRDGISYIITTGPPHSMHLIGRKVKRRRKIRWLADFRDPWSKWDVLDKLNTSPFIKEIHKRMEKSILHEADICVTVSERLSEAFGGIDLVYNGLTIKENPTEEIKTEHFTIGYFGMLNELRNPSKFWILLDKMCGKNTEFASSLKLKLGGIISDSIKHEINQLTYLKDKVEYLGYLPHEKVQEEYRKCSLLLLLLNQSDNAKWILPVKLFEYASANRKILALGTLDSDLADLMKNKSFGVLHDYDQIEQIENYIEDHFRSTETPKEEELKKLLHDFSHEHLTKRLEKLLLDG